MESLAFHKIYNSIFFGFKLQSNKNYVVGRDPAYVYEAHRRRLSRFINMLYDPDRSISYCIRTVARVFNRKTVGGEISTYFLVQMPSKDITKVQQTALSIKMLLAGNFEDTYWKEIVDSEELNEVINPIDFQSSFNAEIHRRQETITADSLLLENAFGFLRDPKESNKTKPDSSIYYVHPFAPPNGGFEKLFSTLLNGDQDMVFTTIISPTKLDDSETDFLYKQISLCEGKQTPEGSKLNIPMSRASGLVDALLRQFLLLQDAPYLMSSYVSSPKPIDKLILEFCGLAITEPVAYGLYSGRPAHSTIYNVGGYDIATADSEEEVKALANQVQTLSHDNWKQDENGALHHRLLHLVEANEALCGFYFPVNAEKNIPGFDTHTLSEQPLPRELVQLAHSNEPKLLIGKNYASGFEQDVYLSEDTRRQHTYIVGQTGTGKSTLMKTMIVSDMKAGNGITVIDPHGELYNDLLEMIPENRKDDVILMDPGDFLYPFGFNFLEVSDQTQSQMIVKDLRAIFKRFIYEYYGVAGEYAGPAFFQHMQNNMLLTMSDIDNPGTIMEFYNIFQRKEYWKRWVPLKHRTPALWSWIDLLGRTSYLMTDKGLRNGDYFSSKFEDFVNDSRLSNIFGQPKSTINLSEAIENNKILLVNLSKGLLGEANASLFGMFVMAKLSSTFMERVDKIRKGQKLAPHYLYVDEFQTIATENFSILLAESRKFGLGLILANQYMRQISDQKILDAIIGNVGTIISFRLGMEDARLLDTQFAPSFRAQDLCDLPNYYAALRTNVRGERTSPCNFKTIKLEPDANTVSKAQLVNRSRNKYCVPVKLAEFLVESSLATPRSVNLDKHVEAPDTKIGLSDIDLRGISILHAPEELNYDYQPQSQAFEFQRSMVKYLMSTGKYSNTQVLRILEKAKWLDFQTILETPGEVDQVKKLVRDKKDQKELAGFCLERKRIYFEATLRLALYLTDEVRLSNTLNRLQSSIKDKSWSQAERGLKALMKSHPNATSNENLPMVVKQSANDLPDFFDNDDDESDELNSMLPFDN